MTRAFLPMLLKANHGAMIVNNTSISSVVPNLMGGIYNMSKAATTMMTDTLGLELALFGIIVIALKTGTVKSKFYGNQTPGGGGELRLCCPWHRSICQQRQWRTIYVAVRSIMVEVTTWAEQVVGDHVGS